MAFPAEKSDVGEFSTLCGKEVNRKTKINLENVNFPSMKPKKNTALYLLDGVSCSKRKILKESLEEHFNPMCEQSMMIVHTLD